MRDIRKGAALRVARRTRPLTNPHPRDASGADCVRVKFKLRLAPHIWNFKFYVKFKIKSVKCFGTTDIKWRQI
ncbi:hypothetical protein [uncultured Campylobacter sp.]|mgnify:CR=1 FL=1|uniref:hypothetical protein n=1 Tax=uncultured Campylobacter sp. TaxID=218934 RepID=UPI002632B912|nr:hypothetical protein [uncultured Campylobacter sp.]